MSSGRSFSFITSMLSSNGLSSNGLLPTRLIPVYLLLFALCLLSAIGCSDSSNTLEPAQSAQVQRTQKSFPKAPWQIWQSEDFGDDSFSSAEQALNNGELQNAVASYQLALDQADSEELRQEALVRKCGTMLKQGRSQKVLEDISSEVQNRGISMSQVGEKLSLLAGYSYWHQRDVDQALAWFNSSIKANGGRGQYSAKARAEVPRLISSLSQADFERFQQRWAADPVIGPIFVKERVRRAQGGSPDQVDISKWFLAATYGDQSVSVADASNVSTAGKSVSIAPGKPRIGVLLPLSGEYRDHGIKVRQGIELALQQFGGQIDLVIADTAGQGETAEREYDRLALKEGVAIVLGPLLVKSSERVAAKSQELGVPFIAFTKRSGLPSLGSSVFRLGATVENQVDEILSYSRNEMAITTFGILYPEGAAGHEFAAYFRTAAQKQGVSVVEQSYAFDDPASALRAVQHVAKSAPKAIFVADSLENGQQVLEQLKKSSVSNSVIFGPAQWNDPIAIRGYGQLLEGAVYVTPFYADSRNPEVIQFVTKYRERYKQAPELLSAQGYDAAQLALSVLAQPVSGTQEVISRLEKADNFSGVTGKLTVDEDGEITRRMTVLRMKQGDVVEVMSSGNVTGFYSDEQRKAEPNNS